MRSPRSLRFVIGTTLLALGGCTSTKEKIHVNPGPDERERKSPAPEVKDADDTKDPKPPEEDHVNVGPEDAIPEGKPDKPVVNVLKTPDVPDEKPAATKSGDAAPK